MVAFTMVNYYVDIGIGAKHRIKMISAIIPSIILLVSKDVNSFKGG